VGRLDNQTIAITGGCGDIGQATARRLSGDGARIILLDVFPRETGEVLADQIAAAPTCRYLVCDVTKRDVVESTLKSLGRLDAVISNAAIVCPDPFTDIKEKDWQDQIGVNLTGSFNVAQTAARLMLDQLPDAFGLRGRILFTSSWVQDMPFPGTCAYITTKGGLKMLAKVMAQELAAKGIRVNSVAPGLVMAGLTKQIYDRDADFRIKATRAIPLGAFQAPESVAAAFAFLCSHDSDYMTGATILVDGGCTLVARE
jgi:NAD(P)-dependent dehydrogenase (short-subunit alcohol dehydrogenase family)